MTTTLLCLIYCSYFFVRVTLYNIFGKVTRPNSNKHINTWVSRLVRLAKARIVVTGHEKLKLEPNKAYIIMSNHSSMYDIPCGLKALEQLSIRMLAKKELRKVPFLGYIMQENEFVFINRKNLNEAKKDLKQAAAIMQSGIMLWVFPEGTRSKDGGLKTFKKGVFHLAQDTQADIIPVWIDGARDILGPHSLKIHKNTSITIRVGSILPFKADETIGQRSEQTFTALEQLNQKL